MVEEKNNIEKNEKQDQETTLDDKKYQNPELRDINVKIPSSKDEKEMQKIREKLEDFKKFILTKFKFVTAIGIIPPQAAQMFDDENELNDEERKEKEEI